MVLNLPFENFLYHPIINNNCNNVVPPVLPLYSYTPGDVLKEEHQYIAQFPSGIINWKEFNIRAIKQKYISAPRDWSLREDSCFEFSTYSMFTFHIFWGSLGRVSSGTQSQLQIRLDPDWLWDLSVYYWWKKGKFLLNLMYTIISWQNKLSWDIHRRGFIITTEKIIRSPNFLKPNCIYSVCFCCKTQDVISYCSQHA